MHRATTRTMTRGGAHRRSAPQERAGLPARLRRGAVSLAAILALGVGSAGQASVICTDDAMIVFDGSGSMSQLRGTGGGAVPRIIEARQAIRRAVPEIARTRRLGLIVYGPGSGAACENVALRVAPRWNAAGPIIGEVEATWPAGATPLTEAVRQAAEALEFRTRPAAVLLVTDGRETCGGSPCRLAARLAEESADLTVHVIALHTQIFPADTRLARHAPGVARCLADLTGGRYESAEGVDDLVAALRLTLGCNLFGARSED